MFEVLPYTCRQFDRHFDLHVFYGMMETLYFQIFLVIIFVIAAAYEKFSIAKISRTTVRLHIVCQTCTIQNSVINSDFRSSPSFVAW